MVVGPVTRPSASLLYGGNEIIEIFFVETLIDLSYVYIMNYLIVFLF